MNEETAPVLVTGASRGLGEALAIEFGRRGRPVALCARSAGDLEEIADRVRREDALCLAEAVDVTDEAAVERWIGRAAAELGPPRVLVNNASVLGPRVPLVEQPVDAWRGTVDINLNGTFIVTRAVVPWMIEAGGGSVINVSSGAAVPPRESWGAYAVSKAAVETFTLNLARELEGTGVRANIVDPGGMRTSMRAAAYPHEDPARLKPPEDATGVFIWLAGAGARHVTGQRFSADEWRAGTAAGR